MDNNEKDTLFYSDLIYEIKKYAGIYAGYDENIEERIDNRKKYDIEMNNEVMISVVSEFNVELYTIINRIMKLSNDKSKNVCDISKYPDLVRKEIRELEKKMHDITQEKTYVKRLKTNKTY